MLLAAACGCSKFWSHIGTVCWWWCQLMAYYGPNVGPRNVAIRFFSSILCELDYVHLTEQFVLK